MTCAHTKTVTSDLRSQGVNAKVTICVECGANVDYRKLREDDVVVTGPSDLPPKEREIQARAKIAKAEKIGMHGLAEKLRKESGETSALPEVPPAPSGPSGPAGLSGPEEVVIETPSDEQVKALLKEKNRLIGTGYPKTGSAPCSTHGGEFPACDEGPGRANNCRNSKWGKLRNFAGPCRCPECHR